MTTGWRVHKDSWIHDHEVAANDGCLSPSLFPVSFFFLGAKDQHSVASKRWILSSLGPKEMKKGTGCQTNHWWTKFTRIAINDWLTGSQCKFPESLRSLWTPISKKEIKRTRNLLGVHMWALAMGTYSWVAGTRSGELRSLPHSGHRHHISLFSFLFLGPRVSSFHYLFIFMRILAQRNKRK